MSDNNLSRRNVLRTTAAGVAAAGMAGIASASEQIDINVGFSNNAGRQAAVDAAGDVKHEFAFNAMSIRAPRSALQGLQNNPNIRYAEEDGRMFALQTTPYGIEKVSADVAISNGETGEGANIAIVDTGIDATHETLADNLVDGWAADDAECSTGGGCMFGGGNDISTCHEVWDDDNNHGTHCAGTAQALDNGVGVLGVAPDATLTPVKVLDRCGSGSWSGVAAGIEWAADQNDVDVLSMSLGGDESSVVGDAVAYADSKGKVQVAAAGNSGSCTDCVGYPAAHDEVIAVSATDENDDLASFSSTGPEVDIAAPGVDVLSAVPRSDYATYSGTSMSCPHVAGAAATLIAAGVSHSNVRQALKDNADDIGLGSNEQGAGRLNVAEALGFDGGDDGDDGDDDDGDDGDDDDDGDDGGDGGDTEPAIDQFSVSTRSTGPWSRADVSWSVSDADGDLDTVTSELLDSSGGVLDSASSSVSGSSASGEHELRTRDNPASVRLTVTDEAGNTASDTTGF